MALICPLCKNEGADEAPDCSRCHTDLTLLQRTHAAARAALRRAGERAAAGDPAAASRLVAEAQHLWPGLTLSANLGGLSAADDRKQAERWPPGGRPVLWVGPGLLLVIAALACGFGAGRLRSVASLPLATGTRVVVRDPRAPAPVQPRRAPTTPTARTPIIRTVKTPSPYRWPATSREGLSWPTFARLRRSQNRAIAEVYRLARREYRRGDAPAALHLFRQVNPYPRTSRYDAPALLGELLCLARLDRPSEAAAISCRLQELYPRTDSARRARSLMDSSLRSGGVSKRLSFADANRSGNGKR